MFGQASAVFHRVAVHAVSQHAVGRGVASLVKLLACSMCLLQLLLCTAPHQARGSPLHCLHHKVIIIAHVHEQTNQLCSCWSLHAQPDPPSGAISSMSCGPCHPALHARQHNNQLLQRWPKSENKTSQRLGATGRNSNQVRCLLLSRPH